MTTATRLVCYISTPMAGVPAHNLPMVTAIADLVTELGGFPVIPHDIPPFDHHRHDCPESVTYPGAEGGAHGGLCHLRADLIVMLGCDAVIMAPGWRKSRGASTEFQTARSVGMPISFYDPITGTLIAGSYEEKPR